MTHLDFNSVLLNHFLIVFFLLSASQSLLDVSDSQPDIEVIDIEDDDLDMSQRPLFQKMMTSIKIKQEQTDEILSSTISAPSVAEEQEEEDKEDFGDGFDDLVSVVPLVVLFILLKC